MRNANGELPLTYPLLHSYLLTPFCPTDLTLARVIISSQNYKSASLVIPNNKYNLIINVTNVDDLHGGMLTPELQKDRHLKYLEHCY